MDSAYYLENKKDGSFEFQPIGFLETCFKEKFGIPRQPGLVNEAKGILQLGKNPDIKTALRSLEGFSHLWLIFVFHQNESKNWKPSIRPPRLGGARKVGVLASRSPHRPNPIGISVVKLNEIDLDFEKGPRIHIQGMDLLDGTPILDIKPYLPYADSVPTANSGWADEEILRVPVEFTAQAEATIDHYENNVLCSNLRLLIRELLSLDPRPAFQKRQLPIDESHTQGTQYGFKLFNFDVKWEIRDKKFVVTQLKELPS